MINTKTEMILRPIEIDCEFGFIDDTGKLVIIPQFDDACFFSEGLACVKLEDKWGYINKFG